MLLVIFDEEIGKDPVLLHYAKVRGEWTLEVFEVPPHGRGRRSVARALVNAIDGVQGDLRWLVERMRHLCAVQDLQPPGQWVEDEDEGPEGQVPPGPGPGPPPAHGG